MLQSLGSQKVRHDLLTNQSTNSFLTLYMCSLQGAPVLEKQEEDESLIPMFLTELILTVQSLLFEPSLEDFLVSVSSLNICV